MCIFTCYADCILQNRKGECEMTILKNFVLWDNGIDKLTIFSIPAEQQYNYIDGITCITFGILYENSLHL